MGKKRQLKIKDGKLGVIAPLCSPSTGVSKAERPQPYAWACWGACLKKEQSNTREKIKTKINKSREEKTCRNKILNG
jgi:hypothetical protein